MRGPTVQWLLQDNVKFHLLMILIVCLESFSSNFRLKLERAVKKLVGILIISKKVTSVNDMWSRQVTSNPKKKANLDTLLLDFFFSSCVTTISNVCLVSSINYDRNFSQICYSFLLVIKDKLNFKKPGNIVYDTMKVLMFSTF